LIGAMEELTDAGAPCRRARQARGVRREPYKGQNVVRNPAITLRPPSGAKPRTTDVE
jgi:hypothetical protein